MGETIRMKANDIIDLVIKDKTLKPQEILDIIWTMAMPESSRPDVNGVLLERDFKHLAGVIYQAQQEKIKNNRS